MTRPHTVKKLLKVYVENEVKLSEKKKVLIDATIFVLNSMPGF